MLGLQPCRTTGKRQRPGAQGPHTFKLCPAKESSAEVFGTRWPSETRPPTPFLTPWGFLNFYLAKFRTNRQTELCFRSTNTYSQKPGRQDHPGHNRKIQWEETASTYAHTKKKPYTEFWNQPTNQPTKKCDVKLTVELVPKCMSHTHPGPRENKWNGPQTIYNTHSLCWLLSITTERKDLFRVTNTMPTF